MHDFLGAAHLPRRGKFRCKPKAVVQRGDPWEQLSPSRHKNCASRKRERRDLKGFFKTTYSLGDNNRKCHKNLDSHLRTEDRHKTDSANHYKFQIHTKELLDT